MAYRACISRLSQAAGRTLTDDEVKSIFERVHKAALDIKAGRAEPGDVGLGPKLQKQLGTGMAADELVRKAAERAAAELEAEAVLRERQAHLQITRLSARTAEVNRLIDTGLKPLDAVEKTIVRDYSGRTNVESLEQRVAGHMATFGRKLELTWKALGDDFLGFFQDKTKLHNLVRELRGEDSGDALAKQGAKAFHDVAEEARRVFNESGGDIGRLDDWGMPQHHSQERVAIAGRDAWIDAILPLLDRTRYIDDLGMPRGDVDLRQFLGKAWDTIATNGHANREPGQFKGAGKRASRHAESRQIHFKDADSVIKYWDAFGEKTAVEILHGHIETMARDIAFIEHFGPNPNVTFQTLKDIALTRSVTADQPKTKTYEGRAKRLESLFNYASGKSTTVHNLTLMKTADGVAHLNIGGKLGGSALASLFGDKPMMEAVAHLNNLPAMKRWQTELLLLNPANAADRRLLQRQGLMLDSVRSGLNRFYEGLGKTGTTGKLANAVMRVTGMQAINDIRKGAFGISLMSAIGEEVAKGVEFAKLHDSDVRLLRNYGITEADWKVWKLADLDEVRGVSNILSPESISRIPDSTLKSAGFDNPEKVRRDAIVKLLGAVNTESEFAIVTPGWKERATFYGGVASQRGTISGEVVRAWLQFKSFPWAMFKRSMDAVANSDGPAGKAMMTAFLLTSTTLAGAMLLQTREVLAGKDPRKMVDEDWHKFWGAAFLQGGALGIYGDFLYGAGHTRYGSGILEATAGPTLGPLLEMGLVIPISEAAKATEGKETHFWAKEFRDLKGFIPGGNIWYAKAAMDHLVWQQIMEAMSPGYLSSVRRRTAKEYGQKWWWEPGELTPERPPELGEAIR